LDALVDQPDGRQAAADPRVVMTAWFFLVWALGAHNGHSYTARVVVDRIVMPTLELCEAARRGMEEELAAELGTLYLPGPCEPVRPGAGKGERPRESRRGPPGSK